ncbi:MAG: YtxH domain-containing protein [Deltaproteobacteria bacterium]|nr:YtxH domain-containing protein [Deltaproteobacteria bacterium]
MDFAKELARHLPEVARHLPELSRHIPTTTDDLIKLAGLQRQSRGGDLLPGMALFGAGLLVGAGLALLLAPTSGRELREEIGERAADLKDRVGAAAEQAADAVSAAAEPAR